MTMTTQYVPLSKLKPSTRNVRKTGGVSVADLAASIEAVGLLQGLVVTHNTSGFEVVAGSRRLSALKLLAKESKIPNDYAVPCQVIADDDATEASTAENSIREAMHPADQFEAFKLLVDSGKGISTVAARFGVSELVVKQRLKLANVSPKLLIEYRAGNASLEQMQALAITDDHAAQEQAFESATSAFGKSPHRLRQVLTAAEISAEDSRVGFIGLEAYEAAGGASRRDLFGDNAYIADVELLDKLVNAKLNAIAAGVRAEGWNWVEVHPKYNAEYYHKHQRAGQPTKRKYTPEEATNLKTIAAKLESIADEMEALTERDLEESDAYQALDKEQDELMQESDDIEESRFIWSNKIKAKAGVLIFLDDNGISIERGLSKPNANASNVDNGKNNSSTNTPEKTKGGLSQKATEYLYGVRTGIIRNALLNDTKLALASLVAALATSNSYKTDANGVIKVRTINTYLTPDWREGLNETAPEVLIENDLQTLLKFEQQQLIEMLVSIAAQNAVAMQEGAQYCAVAGINITEHWECTEEWLAKQPKSYILAALQESNLPPDWTKGVDKLKAGELAVKATPVLQIAGWLPAPFRVEEIDADFVQHEGGDA